MTDRAKFVLLKDEYGDLNGDALMEFHLSYKGPLRATQRDPKTGTKQKHWQLKHDMRVCFHRQLKSAWDHHPVLSSKGKDQNSILSVERLSKEHSIPPWSFVPVVTPGLQVFCGLEIILLRLDHPGDSLWTGDMDNRVKTIIDALDVPNAHSGYGGDIPFEPALNPLFCLLQDDKLLTSLSIETGRLLDKPANADQSWAEVLIKVKIRPENATMLNLGL